MSALYRSPYDGEPVSARGWGYDLALCDAFPPWMPEPGAGFDVYLKAAQMTPGEVPATDVEAAEQEYGWSTWG